MIGVLVSGEGTNLQALIDAGLPVSAVGCNVPDAPALARAEAAGIPNAVFRLDTYPDRDTRDADMAGWLGLHGVELVVCAGYMQILTPTFLDHYRDRIVNVHPSLLPRFPGTTAVEDALAAGVRRTGVTVHVVEEEVDAGRVLHQEVVPVLPGDTVETLRARIQEAEHRVLPAIVRELVEP